MENKIKLQPVSVESLGLSDITARLNDIARMEESPDLDTEKEFREAARYLGEVRLGVYLAQDKARQIPVPSEGTTVFASTSARNEYAFQRYHPFEYYISESPRPGRVSSYLDGTFEDNNYYDGHAEIGKTKKLGRAIKLASDGQHAFAMVENRTENEASDYVAILIGRYLAVDVDDYNGFEIAKIDSPEFAGVVGEEKLEKLLLEDLTIIGGKVYGLYWNRETNSYLELPLKTETSNKVADASDM